LWNPKLITWICRSEIRGKFLNVVLEKDGEDPLDRSCVKRLRIAYSEEGEKYSA
jgi:hypothetical protein